MDPSALLCYHLYTDSNHHVLTKCSDALRVSPKLTSVDETVLVSQSDVISNNQTVQFCIAIQTNDISEGVRMHLLLLTSSQQKIERLSHESANEQNASQE
jgi:hypothetical protein